MVLLCRVMRKIPTNTGTSHADCYTRQPSGTMLPWLGFCWQTTLTKMSETLMQLCQRHVLTYVALQGEGKNTHQYKYKPRRLLHQATIWNNAAVTRLLLGNDADENARDFSVSLVCAWVLLAVVLPHHHAEIPFFFNMRIYWYTLICPHLACIAVFDTRT